MDPLILRLRQWRAHSRWPVALTIAGSDSGGGAGIQADLKTFQMTGVFGVSAVTCVTAQHPQAVRGIWAMDPRSVVRQIETVCEAFPVASAKTGMLYSAAIVRAVARTVIRWRVRHLVVDPVMVATSGTTLLPEAAVQTLCRLLIPRATVVTPNVPEAERLWGCPIRTVSDLCTAAQAIAERFGVACVVKGGHLEGRSVVNVLATNGRLEKFRMRRLSTRHTHGTGCTFSAALAAALAHGLRLPQAVEYAGALAHRGLQHALQVGSHRPLRLGD